jgi:hypothetical protein
MCARVVQPGQAQNTLGTVLQVLDMHTRVHRRVLPAQRALMTRARMMRTTDAGKTSMSVPLLNAEAAPEGAAL